MADSKKITVSGTLSAPSSVSLGFTPLPNVPFWVQLGGTYTGALHYVTQSIVGGPQALAYNSGGPISLYSPGATLINPPYSPSSAVVPVYQLVCKTIISGTVNYTFYQ
jgi:hypothetical protein